jgi:hypothetical protein
MAFCYDADLDVAQLVPVQCGRDLCYDRFRSRLLFLCRKRRHVEQQCDVLLNRDHPFNAYLESGKWLD